MSSSAVRSAVTKYLHAFKLESIRNQILLFAVLVTLIPSGITAWVSYRQNRQALEARLTRELVSASSQAAREMDLWLKERFHELRTLTGSYVVTENLERVSRSAGGTSTRRLNDYLNSVRSRMIEYSEFLILDGAGHPVATTAKQAKAVSLPPDWAKTLRTDGQLVGDAYWDEEAHEPTLVLSVPVSRLDGSLMGAFAAKVRLAGVQEQLRQQVAQTEAHIYLMAPDGGIIQSGQGTSATLMAAKLAPATVDRLGKQAGQTMSYTNWTGDNVVGSMIRVPRVPWAVTTEIPAEAAYQQIRRFRTIALATVLALLIVVSLVAYRLGLVIVRPLDRLTKAAVAVGDGDLTVELPAAGGGEVGLLTDVFTYMVSHLKESRRDLDLKNDRLRKQNEELEELSTHDALTGLDNRRSLGEQLSEEIGRHRRSKQPFTVLMADVDHFKTYNDTHGHPAGDEVLKKVGHILKEAIREVDCAARYGGEEFCVLLSGTPGESAVQVAERIRARIATEKFAGRQITVSIGAAEFPKNGETAEAVVAAADAALYQAKRGGRDRVVRAK